MTSKIIPVYSIERAAAVAAMSMHRERVLIGQTEQGQPIHSYYGTIIVAPGQRLQPSE